MLEMREIEGALRKLSGGTAHLRSLEETLVATFPANVFIILLDASAALTFASK